MTYTHEPEAALLHYLYERKTARLTEVVRHFHHLTFNQVMSAIDRLNRAGKIHLAKQTPFEYAMSQLRSRLHREERGPQERRHETVGKKAY